MGASSVEARDTAEWCLERPHHGGHRAQGAELLDGGKLAAFPTQPHLARPSKPGGALETDEEGRCGPLVLEAQICW